MTIRVQDTFPEAVDTNLEDHTPDIGTGWTQEFLAPNTLAIEAAVDELRSTGTSSNQGTGASAQPDPSSIGGGAQNYNVRIAAKDQAASPDDPVAVAARWAGGQSGNAYGATKYRASANPDLTLVKIVATVRTQIASADVGFTDDAVVELQVRNSGTLLTVLYDDSPEITSNDNAVVASGQCGLSIGKHFRDNDDRSATWRITLFEWEEAIFAHSQAVVIA